MVGSFSPEPKQAQDQSKITSISGEFFPLPDIRPELLVRLQGKLQTSLDVQHLLELFLDEIQSTVLLDGIAYVHPTYAMKIMVGETSDYDNYYHLQSQDSSLGELTVYSKATLLEYELANLESMLTTLVFPIRNSLLYHQALAAAYKDPLTGAGNRETMERTLVREVELSKRTTNPLSILMLDLDYFNRVSDLYGHAVGDKVLMDVVSRIHLATRQSDLCFRYGSEEFLILLSNTPKNAAMITAERVRKEIESLQLKTHASALQITASIGCATLESDEDMEQFMQRADQLLLKAKQDGRNQVIS
ncbi:MAG TPA: GGDEF domain-containing protein [Pseudomonadales bacterium]|nr:GGDEF domain-containing protein [Pseudomonadales bacterium]